MDFVDFSIYRSFSKKSLLFVQVVGSVAAFHKNPVVELPIVIGTHPFLDEPSYPASSATNDNNLRKRLNANSSENAFGFAAPSAPPMPNENSTLKSPYSAVGAQNNGKLKITEQNELFNAVGLFYFILQDLHHMKQRCNSVLNLKGISFQIIQCLNHKRATQTTINNHFVAISYFSFAFIYLKIVV